MEVYAVDFVELESGNVPFKKFLDSLSLEERAEVLAMIEEFRMLKTLNQNLPATMSKGLRDGIFELRVKHRTRTSRSLYFFEKGKKIIFTHGFVKKTQKTPNDEISKALSYKSIYKSKYS
ncbi:MAG: type II toxin-antitoxin system RelE/ParE family toxin [Chloroherpetonaceae bacterium]